MPLVLNYVQMERLEARIGSPLTTALYGRLIAYSEDILQSGGFIPAAKLRDLAGSRHKESAQCLADASLLEEVHEDVDGKRSLRGYQLRDFGTYSGVALLERLQRDQKSRAGKAGAKARWACRDQLELGQPLHEVADATSMAEHMADDMADVVAPPTTPRRKGVSRSRRTRNGREKTPSPQSPPSLDPLEEEVAALRTLGAEALG